MNEPLSFDICVIGGGPAGLMAAARAAECGSRVLLVEKNRRSGRKLLLTGGGRCNVTNEESDRHRFVSRYGYNSSALHSPFSRFSGEDMRALLLRFGVPTRVENEGRVFPVSNQARSVLEAMERYMAEGNVTVWTRRPVTGVDFHPNSVAITYDAAAGGKPAGGPGQRPRCTARACILATGGISRPETGSTGDGLRWLEALGHTVRTPEPSLVPVRIRDEWPRTLQGLALPEARIVAVLDGERQFHGVGKVLLTHFGLSGPLILNLSQRINELAQGGPVDLLLDLMPQDDGGAVERKMLTVLNAAANRKVVNALATMMPSRIVRVLLRLSGVDGERPCHSLTREARRRVVSKMKAMPMRFDGLLGTEHAVVSSGGVSPGQIDFRTMQSKLVPGLFIVGDLLDFERQSGGYSLQLCWSTGFVAGEAAAALSGERKV